MSGRYAAKKWVLSVVAIVAATVIRAGPAIAGPPPVILATGGERCQISHAVLSRAQVYLRLSDVLACRGGAAQLLREDGTILADWGGRQLTIWPWGEPIAVRDGLEVLELPDRPWVWYEGGFYIKPEVLEAWIGEVIGTKIDVAAIPIRYESDVRFQTDLGDKPVQSAGLRVVLDPGHGGEDLGTVDATGVPEKEIALRIAARVARILRARGFDVRLTRTGDTYPTLEKRVQLANEVDADLMLSLHLNSAPRKSASGIETYVLSRTASDPRAQALAHYENAYDGKQTGSKDLLDQLLGDVARQAQENESNRLAPIFHRKLLAAVGGEDRGVRKAPFFVLVGTTMPAFLVELGFLSNESEAARLRGDAHQIELARAVAVAVEEIAPYLQVRAGSALGSVVPSPWK